MVALGGQNLYFFLLKRYIAYAAAFCYRTSHDCIKNVFKTVKNNTHRLHHWSILPPFTITV